MVHQVQRPGTQVERVVTPGSLADAVAALARPGTRPLAGGTDLLIELSRGERRDVETLVDLSRVPGLDDITEHDGIVTVGALVTHNRVVADGLLRRVAAPLAQACREIGSPQLRNRATVIGNLVTASPANDTISALLALDAEVHVVSATGERRIPLGDFHPGIRRSALEPGEMVTAVSFPALTAPWRGVFVKAGNRRAQAISVVHLGLVCRLGSAAEAGGTPVVDEVRLALGSVAPTVIRATDVERVLRGATLDGDTIDRAAEAARSSIRPIDDVRATREYRRRVVGEMVRRALRAIADGDRADPAAGVVDETPVLLQGGGDGRWPTGAGLAAEHGPETPVEAIVNGSPVSEPRGEGTLLDWLRRVGLTGTKEGCAEGECGACTIHLDGQAVLSCLVPPSRAHRADVVTIEGLALDQLGTEGLALDQLGTEGLALDQLGTEGLAALDPAGSAALHPLQEAFVGAGAVQCGYCIPGFLLSGAKLLEERPEPTGAEVTDGLAGNLCRCTGYYKIIEAVIGAGERNGADGGGAA